MRKLVPVGGVLGFYDPKAFELVVNSDLVDFTIDKLPEGELSVFLHEYIHFLQNMTTYYGLNEIYVMSEYMRSVINRIYRQPDKVIKVPYVMTDDKDNVLLNEKIIDLTYGFESESFKDISITNIDVLEDKLPDGSPISEIQSFAVTTDDGNVLSFGAFAIMESMAGMVQRFA